MDTAQGLLTHEVTNSMTKESTNAKKVTPFHLYMWGWRYSVSHSIYTNKSMKMKDVMRPRYIAKHTSATRRWSIQNWNVNMSDQHVPFRNHYYWLPKGEQCLTFFAVAMACVPTNKLFTGVFTSMTSLDSIQVKFTKEYILGGIYALWMYGVRRTCRDVNGR